ncbi:MAG: hypothetical protein OWQ57_05905 [Sulfobacillus sp.]|nr:hypothetical protein [Sulfobacillus sp.]
MRRRHTVYDRPRGLAGKRREPIYYSERCLNGKRYRVPLGFDEIQREYQRGLRPTCDEQRDPKADSR